MHATILALSLAFAVLTQYSAALPGVSPSPEGYKHICETASFPDVPCFTFWRSDLKDAILGEELNKGNLLIKNDTYKGKGLNLNENIASLLILSLVQILGTLMSTGPFRYCSTSKLNSCTVEETYTIARSSTCLSSSVLEESTTLVLESRSEMRMASFCTTVTTLKLDGLQTARNGHTLKSGTASQIPCFAQVLFGKLACYFFPNFLCAMN